MNKLQIKLYKNTKDLDVIIVSSMCKDFVNVEPKFRSWSPSDTASIGNQNNFPIYLLHPFG